MYTDERKLGITFAEVVAKLPGALASHVEQLEKTEPRWIEIQPLKFTDTALRIRLDDSHFGRLYYPLPLPAGDHLTLSWEEVTVITLLPFTSVQLPVTPTDSKTLELVKAQECGCRWYKPVEKLVAAGWQFTYETARVREKPGQHKPNCNSKLEVHISYHAILRKDDMAIRVFNRNGYYPSCPC